MSLMETISQKWMAIVLVIIGLSFLVSYLQGILQMQFYFMAIIVGFIFLGAWLSNKKTESKIKLFEAKDKAQPVIDEYDMGKQVIGLYKINSQGELDIPKSGAYRVDFGGSPRSIVYVDTKSGEPFAWQGNVTAVKTPIEMPKTPQMEFKIPKFKEKIERESKPV